MLLRALFRFLANIFKSVCSLAATIAMLFISAFGSPILGWVDGLFSLFRVVWVMW